MADKQAGLSVSLSSLSPSVRVDCWIELRADQADVEHLRPERARLLRMLLRRWFRQTGLSKRDAFVIQYPPEVFHVHGNTEATVRLSFAIGPDLSRVGRSITGDDHEKKKSAGGLDKTLQ